MFHLKKIQIFRNIDERAFSGCSNLRNVLIQKQINLEIAYNIIRGAPDLERISFYGCYSLKSVSLPFTLRSIDDYGFYNCSNLEMIKITPFVESIGDYSFNGCSKLKSIFIPSSVKSIGVCAFLGCFELDNVTFGEVSYLKEIGNRSFSHCINIASIKLPSHLKEISSNLFDGCFKLKSITISSNVSKIEDSAFLNCYNLECVQYFGTEEPNVSQNAFQGCRILKHIYINSNYSGKTFGSFEVQKTSKLSNLHSSERNQHKNGETPLIVISAPIFIIIICVILFIAVFRRKKNNTDAVESTSFKI